MISENITKFTEIYDSFLSRVTSDMYMELTEVDTFGLLQELLVNAIPRFEFPRVDLFDYELGCEDALAELPATYYGVESNYEEVPSTVWVDGFFNSQLTQEEINILSLGMVIEWLGQQLATTENTKMKFSGSDFKFTSQANHMAKIKTLMEGYKQEFNHAQRVYSRRKISGGKVFSTIGDIMSEPDYGYRI